MKYEGSSAYEEKDFLESFLQRRNRLESPNNSIEKPVIYELLGVFQNKRVLDLGCGDALFGKELLESGALHYHGVEGSEQMCRLASVNLTGLDAQITKSTMEGFDFPESEYDIIASRLAMHYLPEVDQVFRNIHMSLKDNGRFVFSVQHPLTTSSFESKKNGDKRGSWIVDEYFDEGVRQEPWIDKIVVKHHRTIESYFSALTKAGFTVTGLQEGKPKPQYFEEEQEYIRRKRIPVILAFSCMKR
ncbi:class I SAM-dependent methyltransferase [Planococcus donghaensis]|uniref:class I SAM-dependent methyltransferase n=1 Tax=Planococcus donghaensis TaxID=414778 RepID=UPI00373592A3